MSTEKELKSLRGLVSCVLIAILVAGGFGCANSI